MPRSNGASAPATPSRTPGALPNPFQQATDVEPWMKVCLFGPSGSGKTWYGLAASEIGPVAVYDTEGGTDFYAEKFPFMVKRSKSYADLIDAVTYIEQNPGAIKVFVIDPITVIYEVLQDAALRSRVVKAHKKAERERTLAEFDPDNVDLEMLDWGRIKRSYKNLMTRLVNLPCHVIVTARQKDITEKRGNEMVKVGVGPDAEKGTTYHFDVVLRTATAQGQRVFTVEKARGTIGDVLPLGSTYKDPTFKGMFAPILTGKVSKTATPRHVANDDEAASRDSGAAMGEDLAGTTLASEFAAALIAAGYDPEEVRHTRGWLPFAEMPKATIAEALAKLQARAAGASADTEPGNGQAAAAADEQAPETATEPAGAAA